MVDVGSLTVQAQQQELENYRHVDDQIKYINSMTYMNRRHNERWCAEDTDLFFKGLAFFGTDFTAIATLFPNRDRCGWLCFLTVAVVGIQSMCALLCRVVYTHVAA